MNFSVLLQPSSFAGYGLAFQGVQAILAHDYANGLAMVGTALVAIFKSEGR